MNDSIFPVNITDQIDLGKLKTKGLTKRELFAAMAMQGMLSARSNIFGNTNIELAKTAVYQADALIEQLNQTENNNE